MRIVYVSTRSDAIGGSNVHIRDLAIAMQARGHEVVVLGGQDGAWAADVRRHGVAYEPLRHLIRAVRPARDVAAVRELRAALRRLRPDLISLHTAKAGTVGRLAAWGSGVPVLYTPHGWSFTPGMPPRQASLYAAVERAMAPLATRIVNVCDFEQQVAARRRVGRAAQHARVHNGMPDVPESLRATPGATPPRIVMIARFEEPKEHAVLLRALASSLDLAWSLQFVGDGPREGATKRLASELGLAERVAFLGVRHDVPEVLAVAQACALVTRWEGFPRSVLEAMRAGLPVVASAAGGVHEAVEDGVSGFVVPLADEAALALQLRRLIGDPALRERFGRVARERYAERFTFDAMLHATIALYESALAERRG